MTDAQEAANAAAKARDGHIEASHAQRATAQQPGMTKDIFNNRATFSLSDHMAGLKKAVASFAPEDAARVGDLEAKFAKIMERSNDIEARNAALASENAALKAKLGV